MPAKTIGDKYRDASEANLIAWAQKGDREAFGQLVQLSKEKVYMTALQMTRNHADADEFSQEAFLKAFQSLGQFRGGSSFSTWMYRIVVNVCLTRLKGQKRWVALPGSDDGDGASAPEFGYSENAGDGIEKAEAREKVGEALAKLGPEIRAAVVLVYLQDLTPREAAVSLGCAEATVHWRLFRARKLLQKYLRDDDERKRTS